MARKRNRGLFLDAPASSLLLLALVALIWFQGESLRNEIRDLRTAMRTEIGDLRTEVHTDIGDLRTEVHSDIVALRTEVRTDIGDLRGEVGDLSERVAKLEVTVARIEAWHSLHPMLAERFAATGEGASYGGPAIAANLLLARALPEIDSVLGTSDQEVQSGLADDLWEDRAIILARADPIP